MRHSKVHCKHGHHHLGGSVYGVGSTKEWFRRDCVVCGYSMVRRNIESLLYEGEDVTEQHRYLLDD